MLLFLVNRYGVEKIKGIADAFANNFGSYDFINLDNQAKLDALKAEVIGVIESLESEDYKNVLMISDIRFLTWDEIAE